MKQTDVNRDLLSAMRFHRLIRTVNHHSVRRTDDNPNPLGPLVDTAHMNHWHALQRAGIPAGQAGDICAAISRTRLPR